MGISSFFSKETKRLELSLIQADDVTAVFETMNSKNTAETISFLKWPMTLEQAEAWCAKAVAGLKSQSELLFLARNKNDDAAIGCICLLKKEEPNIWEVGYWVTEQWQGKGYATEMLSAIMEVAFERCGAKKLLATAALGNVVSAKVLENQKFKIIGEKTIPTAKGVPLSCYLFEFSV